MKSSTHPTNRTIIASLTWALFVCGTVLVNCAAMPALGQTRRRTAHANERTIAETAEPHYLLFWRASDRAAELIKTIGAQGDGRARFLGFGLPCSTFLQEKQAAGTVHLALQSWRGDCGN